MQETDTNENTDTKSQLDFFEKLNTIPVELTYYWQPEKPIVFNLRLLLTTEEQKIRQKHFAKTEDEQAESKHAYTAELLSKICVAPPENLPGFDEWRASLDAGTSLENAVYSFFIRKLPALIEMSETAIELYSRKSRPVEFFR